MTVAELIDGLDIPATYKGMVKNVLRTFTPGTLESQLNLAIDRQRERVTLRLAGQVVLDKSFTELESYAQPDG